MTLYICKSERVTHYSAKYACPEQLNTAGRLALFFFLPKEKPRAG